MSRDVPARMTTRMTTTLASTVMSGETIAPYSRACRTWTTIRVSALAGEILLFIQH